MEEKDETLARISSSYFHPMLKKKIKKSQMLLLLPPPTPLLFPSSGLSVSDFPVAGHIYPGAPNISSQRVF